MHRFLGDPVAVKLLRSGLADDEAAVAAFVAEAERTRAIDHPAVVRVIDFGRDDATGQCYLVMERVDGETLSARIARGALPEAEVRRLGAALADGMAAAHARGIVHRDLKPGNVVLRGGAPIIVDFGIAKALGQESAAQTSRRVGTPPYMAPEQLVSGMITPGVDIWALGAVLFETATGRRPYTGHDEGRCPQLVEDAPRARTLAPISVELDDLLARCLEREPGRRPASMATIASVLRGLAPPLAESSERRTEDLGPIAPSPSPSGESREPPTTVDPAPQFGRSSRRRWFVVGGIAAAALIAAVAVFAMSTSSSSEPSSATRDPSSAPRIPAPETRRPSPETATETGTEAETETETGSVTTGTAASSTRPAKKPTRRSTSHRPDKRSRPKGPPDVEPTGRPMREGLD